ncbi:uncharacterized protein LOC144176016 [Haemaphysalis longicornis]
MNTLVTVVAFACVALTCGEDHTVPPACALTSEQRPLFVECLTTNATEVVALLKNKFECENMGCVLDKYCALEPERRTEFHDTSYTESERSSIYHAVISCRRGI